MHEITPCSTRYKRVYGLGQKGINFCPLFYYLAVTIKVKAGIIRLFLFEELIMNFF